MTKIESTYVNEAIRNNKSKENELYARKIRCIFDKEGYKKICFTKGKRIILFQSRINGCSRMTKKKNVEQKLSDIKKFVEKGPWEKNLSLCGQNWPLLDGFIGKDFWFVCLFNLPSINSTLMQNQNLVFFFC